MTTFTSAHEAKEFLIDLIVQEAQQESVPLSETERKMLYFSETASTLPDIWRVNEDFDRDYDQDEYEKKIGSLVWDLRERLKKENADELKTWDAAVRQLRSEDHYLLVVIDAAGPVKRGHTFLWSFLLAFVIGGIIFAYIW
jgi:hypothetical protein